jgi:uncharacterized protein DUF3891
MILLVDDASATEASGQDAWPAFEKTQRTTGRLAGCISQPAHAALAARLAAALTPEVFGALPSEVIDAIGRHDAGWAESDLNALECVADRQPQSFMACAPESGVDAWRNSIREAETRSPLAGILTSRHFCLLAPRDSDPHHAAFVEQENRRRNPLEAVSSISRDDLDRFTAALGFCDLLSLCLCSGLAGSVQLPLAHPAAGASRHAPKVTILLAGESIRFDPQIIAPGALVHVDGWGRLFVKRARQPALPLDHRLSIQALLSSASCARIDARNAELERSLPTGAGHALRP